MNNLRKKLIRLAHNKRGLRGELLPLLKEGKGKEARLNPYKWAQKRTDEIQKNLRRVMQGIQDLETELLNLLPEDVDDPEIEDLLDGAFDRIREAEHSIPRDVTRLYEAIGSLLSEAQRKGLV